MSAPPARNPRSQFVLAVALFGLTAVPGLFVTYHASAPRDGAPVPRLESGLAPATLSYRPRLTSNREKRPPYESVVAKYASLWGVRAELVHAVILKESRGNPLAVGVAGEQGLMQLMPTTAQELGVRNPFDVEENIRGGVEYLSRLLKRFGDERKALAAYHTGPGKVSKEGVTPRGHAYASEVLVNAKEHEERFRTGHPAQVAAGFDTRVDAPVPDTLPASEARRRSRLPAGGAVCPLLQPQAGPPALLFRPQTPPPALLQAVARASRPQR